jgi:2-polyprenyl-6-methoxyphenol hydroxylase-like FAD-dependent oxidoreductase
VSGVKIAERSGVVLNVPVGDVANVPHAPFIAMKRSILDSLLLSRTTMNGVNFSHETLLEAIDSKYENSGEWQIGLRSKDSGELFNVTCRLLVGADGRNSRVASLLEGERKETHKESSPDRIGVQFLVKRPIGLDSNVIMFFFDGGYGGIVGVTTGEANVAMVVSQELARLAMTDFAQFISRSLHSNQYARTVVPRLELTGEIHTAFPITPRANHSRHPNAFLIGDARHTTEPFTGEGIFFAMQDGIRVAQKISKSFGLSGESEFMKPRSRFWVDTVFSPILRRGKLAENLIDLGARHATLTKLVAKAVLK